jgi:spore coat polysaccharide biosynthesis protein SpsF
VIRVTSDCPLLDPDVASGVLAAFRAADVDYASDSLPPLSWPRGLDVEVVGMPALERAWREDADPAWREHATPFIYRHPELFRLLRVPAEHDLSEHRWCVDTAEDYELVRRIYETVGQPDFGWQAALAAVEANPAWGTLNRNVVQKTVPG